MNKTEYLKSKNWFGSYFELAIEFSSDISEDMLLSAIQRLWKSSHLIGPWSEESEVFSTSILPKSLERFSFNKLYGILELANHQKIGCLTLTVCEENGSNWLDLCIPSAMLELINEVDYPITGQRNPWLREIEGIFIAIAQEIYKLTPFKLALIGEEVSGSIYARDVYSQNWKEKAEENYPVHSLGILIIPSKNLLDTKFDIEFERLDSDLLLLRYDGECV